MSKVVKFPDNEIKRIVCILNIMIYILKKTFRKRRKVGHFYTEDAIIDFLLA